MIVRRARPEEAAAITDLALRSKASWGYDQAFLTACRAELTWTTADVERDDVLVAEADGALAGFAARRGSPPEGRLEAVFVDPGLQGGGTGRALVAALLDRAAADGYRSLEIEADPHAEGFSLRLGAVRVGSTPSGSIPGRVLPLLRFDLGRPRRGGTGRASAVGSSEALRT